MKLFITSIFIALFFQVSLSQDFDNATKNKIRVKFIAAEDAYKDQAYNKALTKIQEVESLLGNVVLPTALNLKIKALVGLRRYADAQKELDLLQNFELDDVILKDVSVYSKKIENGIQQEELRQQKIREKELAEDADKRNWESATALNTVDAYENYLDYSSNKLYRSDAKSKIDRLNWQTATSANTIASYKSYLGDSKNKLYRNKAKNRIEAFELQTADGLENFYTKHTPHEVDFELSKNKIKTSSSFYHSAYKKRIYSQRWGSLDAIQDVEVDKFNHDRPEVYFTGRFRRYTYIYKKGTKKEFVTAAARQGGYKKGQENYVTLLSIEFETFSQARKFVENFKKFLVNRNKKQEDVASENVNDILIKARDYYKANNLTKSVELFTKAADLGDENAAYIVAVFYHQGTEIPQNLGLAKKYYLKALAVNPNNADANQNLGLLIMNDDDKLVAEINNNINNNDVYNRLVKQRKELLLEALPYFKKAYQHNASEDLKGMIENLEDILSTN